MVLGIPGLIGFGIILALTSPHGAGMTPDSVTYISVARNLAEGHGFLIYNDTDFIAQPPLYPILLATIQNLFSLDPQVSAGYLNALLFGLIIFLSGLLLLKYMKSITLVFLGTISALVSYALVKAASMALSEPLFIFLVLLFLYFFDDFLSNKKIIPFFLSSVSASLICLTRYTGVIIILTGIISIFIWSNHRTKEKLWHSFVFTSIAAIPLGLWIIRNYILSDTLVGHRAQSSYSLSQNINYFMSTITPWFLPLTSIRFYILIIFLIMIIWLFIKSEHSSFHKSESIRSIGPSLIFLIFYSCLIVISSTTTAYDKISDRLLSPIYIPIILTLFFIFDKIIHLPTKTSYQILLTLLLVICYAFLVKYPIKNTLHFIKGYNELSGWGLNSELWRESETINYLNHQDFSKSNNTFFSNEPSAVYIQTKLKAQRSPARTFYNSPKLTSIIPNKKENWLNAENIYLIWLNKSDHNFLYTIEELQEKISMTEVAQLRDGRIYTFSMK